MPFIPLPDEDKDKWDREPCRNPEHNPPSHIYLKPGRYIWECPGCGVQMPFTVPHVRMGVPYKSERESTLQVTMDACKTDWIAECKV